jgi:MFS family permease
VPILGALKPWQLVIVVPGLGGILVSFLLLTVREPPRLQASRSAAERSSFAEMFRYVREHRRVYAPLFASIVFGPMAVSAWGAWLPAAIGRMWGLPTAEIGHMTGYLALAALPINALIIGYFMDRVSRGGTRRDRTIWFAMAIGTVQIVPALLILLAPSIPLMWTGYAGSMLLTNATGVAGALSLAQVTPGPLMGKLTSFYFLVANLLGLAIGPTVTALVAELFSGKLAIVDAMTLCYPLLSGLNILFLGIFAVRLKAWQRVAEAR